jgi:hypothetical protein
MRQASDNESDFELYQRQLALVDENIGLRASLAQESVRNSPSRLRLEQLEHEISQLRGSTTWRVGRLVMTPARVIRRLLRRSGS